MLKLLQYQTQLMLRMNLKHEKKLKDAKIAGELIDV